MDKAPINPDDPQTEVHEVYEDIETHREERTTETPADNGDDAPEYRDTGDSELTKDE